MKPNKASLLLHPVFIISLISLLLNDFYWKCEYSNWLTGKLSDFAGLIVLPVFCRALFPSVSRNLVIISCSIFFIWWKSPFSQFAINFLNDSFYLPVDRVVDYSDTLAIMMLPLAMKLSPQPYSTGLSLANSMRWVFGVITIVSLCSTSMRYPREIFHAHANVDDVYFHEGFKQKRSAEAILQTLVNKKIGYRIDSVMYYPLLNQQSLYRPIKNEADSIVVWKQVSQLPDSALYVKMQGKPYYLIPVYSHNGEIFHNIRFTLSENEKKTKTNITIETFLHDKLRSYDFYDNDIRKECKIIFKELFSE